MDEMQALTSKSYSAFIFDLDDTLVNTSEVVCQVLREWCVNNRVDYEAAITASRGTRTQDTIALLAPHLDCVSEASWIEEREAEVSTKLKPILGAEALLQQMCPQRWAVATSSSLALARVKLGAAKLPLPQVIVSAESVAKGKPDPEPYRLAAKLLGCLPEQCLAFEDADSGIRSALRAGCDVFVIGSAPSLKNERLVGQALDYSALQLVDGRVYRLS